MRRPSPQAVVEGKVKIENMSCVKKVIVLKGYQNEGKTTTLKEVVRQLYQKFPNCWHARRKFEFDKFDISIVAEEKKSSDRLAVFKINGIIVLLYTGGDNPNVISRTFATAIRYRAEIVITALKVSVAGSEKTPAQIAYEFIEQRSFFESTYVDICGRKLRSIEEEREYAHHIVEIVQSYVSPKQDK